VLKGGITSGVVYPLALVSLAEQYRFSSIGGTSAGAIAAAAAAAAEYGRLTPDAGFDRLAKIPVEVGPNLLSMFQPTPVLKPLFDIFVAGLKAKNGTGGKLGIMAAVIGGYWRSLLLGLLPGAIVLLAALLAHCGAGYVLFGALLALIGLVLGLIQRLWKAANTDLGNDDFGMCPGISQPCGSGKEGFTDWLARLIEEAAGHVGADRPLTFGDLAAPPGGRPPIQLAMMTTSLMEERPYTLPLPKEDRRFVFEKSEWTKIFPAPIMKFLSEVCDPFTPLAGERGEFYHFPDPDRLPLIVGARMSLSFPFLISGVPLWRRDFTLIEGSERDKLRRCFFSDGGLSSNFPIHFFDRLMPNNPTFAITLDDWDVRRNYDHVWLPHNAAGGTQIPILPFSGLGGFLMRILMSAKDWQDNLQSTLPGYRERIVHVVLDANEGGLNLAMDEKTIDTLVGYGKDAGVKLRDQFDFDANRWRRFLVAMARMEETLDDVAKAYEGVPGGVENFAEFLRRYSPAPDSYRQDATILEQMLKRCAELAATGASWRTKPTVRDGKIPLPPTDLRITSRYSAPPAS
jgi:hypothetical protein